MIGPCSTPSETPARTSPGEAAPMSALTSFEITGPTTIYDPADLWIPVAPPALAARSAVKRAMDLAGSIGGLILLSPLLAVVGLLVWLESRGPVLFRQPPVGPKRPGVTL